MNEILYKKIMTVISLLEKKAEILRGNESDFEMLALFIC